MIEKLKQEYSLRHSILSYKKMHKAFCLMCFEKNNYERLKYYIREWMIR